MGTAKTASIGRLPVLYRDVLILSVYQLYRRQLAAGGFNSRRI